MAAATLKSTVVAAARTLAATFHAWLATDTADAKANLKGSGPWYVGTNKIADLALLTSSGSLATPWLTEAGQSPGATKTAWTGTTTAGAVYANTNCNNWTSSSGAVNGEIGLADSSGGSWTDDSTITCDSTLRRLYCFEE